MKELLARFTAYFARLSSLERRFIVIAIVVVFVVGNLWFVLVNHAGHMVPTDQPEAAFNMLGHFVFNNRDWMT